jgi:hypothetical protein
MTILKAAVKSRRKEILCSSYRLKIVVSHSTLRRNRNIVKQVILLYEINKLNSVKTNLHHTNIVQENLSKTEKNHQLVTSSTSVRVSDYDVNRSR